MNSSLTASRSTSFQNSGNPNTLRTCGKTQNVGEGEKWLSLLGGGGLVLYGLERGSFAGALSVLAGASLLYRGWTGHCMAYEQLGISTADRHQREGGVRAQHGRKVTQAVHVNRPPQEVYEYWRNLTQLPEIMQHVKSVTPLNEQTFHWVAASPLGQTLEWDAEIITDKPGEIIAWRSLPGSEVDTAGSVRFQAPPFGEGTDVIVSLKYDPPGGRFIAKLAHLFGLGLEGELREDLRQFKQKMETGEITTATQHPQS